MSHPTIGKPYINPYVFRYQPKFFHISTHMFHIYISIYIYIYYIYIYIILYIYQPICFTWHWNHPCLVSFSPRSQGIGVPNTKSPGRGSGRTWCGSPGDETRNAVDAVGRLCRHGDMGNDREKAATLWEWVNCIKFPRPEMSGKYDLNLKAMRWLSSFIGS